MMCINKSDIASITVKNVNYHCIMYDIAKSAAINLLENSMLEDRGYDKKSIVLISSLFKTVVFYFFV